TVECASTIRTASAASAVGADQVSECCSRKLGETARFSVIFIPGEQWKVASSQLVVSSALKIGAKCFVFSERFSTFVAPIFIALRVSQSDMTTQFCPENFGQAATPGSSVTL